MLARRKIISLRKFTIIASLDTIQSIPQMTRIIDSMHLASMPHVKTPQTTIVSISPRLVQNPPSHLPRFPLTLDDFLPFPSQPLHPSRLTLTPQRILPFDLNLSNLLPIELHLTPRPTQLAQILLLPLELTLPTPAMNQATKPILLAPQARGNVEAIGVVQVSVVSVRGELKNPLLHPIDSLPQTPTNRNLMEED